MSEVQWFQDYDPEQGHIKDRGISAQYLADLGVVEVHGKWSGTPFFIWLSESDWDALVVGVEQIRKESGSKSLASEATPGPLTLRLTMSQAIAVEEALTVHLEGMGATSSTPRRTLESGRKVLTKVSEYVNRQEAGQ